MSSTPLIRGGRPHDAQAAAPLIHASGPRAFDYVFGPRAIELVRECFERDEGIFGCSNHDVSELDGRVVGVGAFYDMSRLRSLAAPTLGAFTCFYGVATPSVLARALELEALMPGPAGGELYVAHLGVERAFRGRGIMTAMLERRIELAREDGEHTTIALDVARGNLAAERLYEHLGFRVIELRRSKVGTGASHVPDHLRMVLELR